MNAYTLFFIVIGVTEATLTFFRFIDWVEEGGRHD